MMLMLRVLAWVPVCLAASACMSAFSVWGWPLEPDLLAASGWCAHRFHGRKKERGREWETLVSERCCAPACMGVNVCCMFNEANWSRVSRMHTRLMAWLQPCDTKQSALVCLCVCARALCPCVEMMHQWLNFCCQTCACDCVCKCDCVWWAAGLDGYRRHY